MRLVSQALAAVLAATCVAPLAFAQPAPSAGAAPQPSLPAASSTAPPRVAPADPKAIAPLPGATPSSAGTPTADTPIKPPIIEVDDPLLTPVPAAAHTISGFREVLSLLSNQSTSLRIATLDIERAKGQRRQVLAGALPAVRGTLSAGTALSAGTLPDPTGQAQLTISTSLVDTRTWYAVGTADVSIEGSKLRAGDARRTAIAVAANTIVGVVTSERVAEINRVGLRAALERLELTKRRRRLGSGTDLDIVRAEQDAASARGQIVTGDESLRKARESLGQLFNSSEGYGVPPSFSLNDIEQAMKSSCHPDKVDNRTDVLAAKADLTVAERGVTDVKLAYVPTLGLSTTFGLTTNASQRLDPVTQTLIPGDVGSWSISAVLTLPIWDGGARYGQARIASAQVEQAKVRVEQTTVTATLEATQAQRSISVAAQAKTVSEASRDLARETARLSQIAFESGAGTSLDLVDSGRLLRQAELDMAVKELEVVRAKIAALLALSACDI